VSAYAARMLRLVHDIGPHEDEGFFRLKVTGAGQSPWVNVTPGQLAAIADILDTKDD
jgi:hypothetical protein